MRMARPLSTLPFRNDNPEMAKLLCRHGAKLDPAKARPRLHAAVYLENQEMATLLLESNADVNLPSNGTTPLSNALNLTRT